MRSVQERGKDIFRSKGTLCIHGQKRMFNFQGVHETFQFAASKLLTEADADNPHSEIVFIGRDLDKDAIKQVCTAAQHLPAHAAMRRMLSVDACCTDCCTRLSRIRCSSCEL